MSSRITHSMQPSHNLVISQAQQELVVNATNSWVKQASLIFNQRFETIPTVFDLKGRTSGMFCIRLATNTVSNRLWIRYNPEVFAKHFEDSLATTVPHEVAHYICYCLYDKGSYSLLGQLLSKSKPKPHGKEWKAIMARFGMPANATCKLDTSDLPQKRLKRFAYQCSCRTHELTSIRHNRILQGKSSYACPKCRTALKPVCA